MRGKGKDMPDIRNSAPNAIALACLALLYLFGAAAIALAPNATARAALADYAFPLDCMVVLPALFYFAIVKRNGLSPLFVLPIMWAGAALATFFAQNEALPAIAVLACAALAAEAVIAIREITRFAKAVQTARKTSEEAHAWFLPPLMRMTKNARISKLAANEFAVLYYALFSWRRATPSGDTLFSYHKSSGYSSFVAGMMLVIPIEMTVMHLLVSQWNAAAAWALTLASVYAALWIIADCRASILNPIAVKNDVVQIRSGMRFSADVPLDAVAAFVERAPETDKAKLIDLGVMGNPSGWLVFAKPVRIETFFGTEKTVEAIGIAVDGKARFSHLIGRAASK